MKDRGKSAAIDTTYVENTKIPDFNYSVSSDIPCIKHPNSSPIGICSFCLKDKLLNLICSNQDDPQRTSSPCSVEVGSVGRISFLLENEKQSKTEQVILLRSTSKSVEIKKNRNGFWKIKRLFKKNREKGDEKSEVSGPINGVVSRSRSLCSFRGGGDDGNNDYRFSSAKISDVTGGILMDSDEPRKSGFRSIFPVKESDFTSMDGDDSAFIDLKLDLSSDSMRLSNASDNNGRVRLDLSGGSGNGAFRHSGSCRMSGKGNKVWKWIFRQTSGGGRKSTSINRDENDIFKS